MTDERSAIDPLRLAGEQPADYLRSVLDRAHEAFVAIDAGGFVIDWNRQAERTFGWTREEALGRVLAHLIIPERDRDAHLRGLEHYTETGEAPILDQRLELSAIDRAGREFAVEVTISADPTPDIPRFYAFLHDISERKRGERMLRAQHAVAQVFVEAQSTADAARGLLAELGAAMDWEFGAWWSPDEAGEMLVCRSVWCREPTATAEFEAITFALELPRGLALPGRVWESGELAWTADLAADERFPRRLLRNPRESSSRGNRSPWRAC